MNKTNTRNNNFRRIAKNLIKDINRGKFKENGSFEKYMEQFGFYRCRMWYLVEFLKTDIKSRGINRIRKAALKRGKLVDLWGLILVWRKKKETK